MSELSELILIVSDRIDVALTQMKVQGFQSFINWTSFGFGYFLTELKLAPNSSQGVIRFKPWEFLVNNKTWLVESSMSSVAIQNRARGRAEFYFSVSLYRGVYPP